MPVKDTHQYAKSGDGQMRHYWTEEGEYLYTQLRINDEADSATFIMNAKSKGMYTPSMDVEVEVRMTYADLRKLVTHAEEILKEREQ